MAWRSIGGRGRIRCGSRCSPSRCLGIYASCWSLAPRCCARIERSTRLSDAYVVSWRWKLNCEQARSWQSNCGFRATGSWLGRHWSCGGRCASDAAIVARWSSYQRGQVHKAWRRTSQRQINKNVGIARRRYTQVLRGQEAQRRISHGTRRRSKPIREGPSKIHSYGQEEGQY